MFGLGLGRLGLARLGAGGGSATPSNALLIDGTPLLIDGQYIIFT